MEPAPKKQMLSSPPRSEEEKMETSEEKMVTKEEQKMEMSEQKMETNEEKMVTSEKQKMDTREEQKLETSKEQKMETSKNMDTSQEKMETTKEQKMVTGKEHKLKTNEEQKMETNEEQKLVTSEKQKLVTNEKKMMTREKQKMETSKQQPDDDMESDLPTRGRDSKKLIPQKQKKRCKNRVKLMPESNHIGVSLKEAGAPNRMCLFGRSLDLSKYKQNTPLYPICRAWVANQPGNPAVSTFNTEGSVPTPKREEFGGDILAGLRSGEIKVLANLPAPKPTDLPIIPPRLELGQEERLEDASCSELLAVNMVRWKKVRAHWVKHIKEYQQERFGVIDQIMSEVCKKTSN